MSRWESDELMGNPLLSVLVPTYNRYHYLKESLAAMTSFQSEKFEIIVQDNTAENEEMVEYIKKLSDSRIKYYHIRKHICVSDNCDQSMSHAKGEYVCMLGDDDTICENMIDAIKFCNQNGIEAANINMSGFNWPDMTFEGKQSEANLFFKWKADGTVRLLDAQNELSQAINTAEGLRVTMPRAYHGIVSKRIMELIFQKTGSYFPGPSPDMGNAAAVCLLAQKTAYINDYLMVSGYGYKSARGEGNRQQHYGRPEEKPWLPRDILARWDKEILPVFSGETITATSLTESLRRMGRKDLVEKYDYGALYAIFLWNHHDALSDMLSFCLKKPSRAVKMMKGFMEKYIARRERIQREKKVPIPAYFSEDAFCSTLGEALEKTALMRKNLGIDALKFESKSICTLGGGMPIR